MHDAEVVHSCRLARRVAEVLPDGKDVTVLVGRGGQLPGPPGDDAKVVERGGLTDRPAGFAGERQRPVAVPGGWVVAVLEGVGGREAQFGGGFAALVAGLAGACAAGGGNGVPVEHVQPEPQVSVQSLGQVRNAVNGAVAGGVAD